MPHVGVWGHGGFCAAKAKSGAQHRPLGLVNRWPVCCVIWSVQQFGAEKQLNHGVSEELKEKEWLAASKDGL